MHSVPDQSYQQAEFQWRITVITQRNEERKKIKIDKKQLQKDKKKDIKEKRKKSKQGLDAEQYNIPNDVTDGNITTVSEFYVCHQLND